MGSTIVIIGVAVYFVGSLVLAVTVGKVLKRRRKED